jgi:hypothetical protein
MDGVGVDGRGKIGAVLTLGIGWGVALGLMTVFIPSGRTIDVISLVGLVVSAVVLLRVRETGFRHGFSAGALAATCYFAVLFLLWNKWISSNKILTHAVGGRDIGTLIEVGSLTIVSAAVIAGLALGCSVSLVRWLQRRHLT